MFTAMLLLVVVVVLLKNGASASFGPGLLMCISADLWIIYQFKDAISAWLMCS